MFSCMCMCMHSSAHVYVSLVLFLFPISSMSVCFVLLTFFFLLESKKEGILLDGRGGSGKR